MKLDRNRKPLAEMGTKIGQKLSVTFVAIVAVASVAGVSIAFGFAAMSNIKKAQPIKVEENTTQAVVEDGKTQCYFPQKVLNGEMNPISEDSINTENGIDYEKNRVLAKLTTEVWNNTADRDYDQIQNVLNKFDSVRSVRGLLNLSSDQQKQDADELARWVVLDLSISTESFLSECFIGEEEIFQYFDRVEPNISVPILQEIGNISPTCNDMESLPDDPLLNMQWYILNCDQGTAGADIKTPESWEYLEENISESQIVAVIDTGFDIEHEDFNKEKSLWVNPLEDINGNGILDGINMCPEPNGDFNCKDDDGNGLIDDMYGWNYAYGNNDLTDDHGHGTHVGGVIVAEKDNGKGISGIADSARIMPLKYSTSEGSGSVEAIVKSIHYAVSNGASVLNNSYGYPASEPSQALQDAVNFANEKDAIFVAAAGNFFFDMYTSTLKVYPATLDHVLSVGGTSKDEYRYSGSNFGLHRHIQISAPGEEILSLRATGQGANGNPEAYFNGDGISDSEGKYMYLRGTSMASPMVAGAVAAVRSVYPNESKDSIESRIISNADDLLLDDKNIDHRGRMGYGRLDIFQALTEDVKPIIAIDGYRAEELQETPDLLLEAGEKVKVIVDLKNFSTKKMNSSTVTVTSLSEYITLINDQEQLPSLEKNQTEQISFVFNIDKEIPNGEKFEFEIMVLEEGSDGIEKKLYIPLYTWDKPTSEGLKMTKTIHPRAYFDLSEATDYLNQFEMGTTVFDVDNDGKEEIFSLLRLNGKDSEGNRYRGTVMHVLDSNLEPLPGWPQLLDWGINNTTYFPPFTNAGGWVPPALGNIDNDSDLELVLVDSKGAKLYAWDLGQEFDDGLPRIKEGFPKETPLAEIKNSRTNSTVPGSWALANMVGDEKLEIIWNSRKNLYMLNEHGEVLGHKVLPISGALSSAFISIEKGSDSEYDKIFFVKKGVFYGFEKNLREIRRFPIPLHATVDGSVVAIGDVNGDGLAEFSFVLEGNIYVYDEKGRLLPGWPIKISREDYVHNSMISMPIIFLVDYDGGGDQEICFILQDKIRILDSDGQIVEDVDFDSPDSAVDILFLIKDITDDGKVDFLWSTSGSATVYEKEIFAIDGSTEEMIEGFPIVFDDLKLLEIPIYSDLESNKKIDILNYRDFTWYVWERDQIVDQPAESEWPMVGYDIRNSNHAK